MVVPPASCSQTDLHTFLDMQKYTQYSGGYSSMSGAIRNFWKAVREMTPAEQKKLVKFITGYPPENQLPVTIKTFDRKHVSKASFDGI